MKTKFNILKYGIIAWAALIAISCDKQETETDFSDDVLLEEGFMSTTKHFDSEMEESQEVLSPLLHRSYDGSLSPEETEARFHTEVVKQQKEVGQTNKISNRFHFRIMTATDSGRYDGTDAYVEANVLFNTDKGYLSQRVILNNPGDDRKRGEYDYYEFVIYMPNISWVEIKSASLHLQGTDGWNVDLLSVFSYLSFQDPTTKKYEVTIVASMNYSDPIAWLDNTTTWGWDSHYIYGGNGRITF